MRRHSEYGMLGLPPGTSPGEVRQTYRDLVVAWDPERFGDPELRGLALQRLQEIRAAYRALSDAEWSAGDAGRSGRGPLTIPSAGVMVQAALVGVTLAIAIYLAA